MTVQHRPTALCRARAVRRLLVSSAVISGLGGGHAVAQVLPTAPVQIPQSGGLTDVAKITTFNPDGTPAHANFGMRVDLQDKNRVIDWATFNVGSTTSSAEQVDFTTASNANLAVLNRVTLANPSSIFGSITAKSNITVWLVNPSGITFGNTGSFSGGSLVLSTAQTTAGFDAKFINGTQALPLTAPALGQGGIVLQAGSGLLATAGPILLVAQNITANTGSTITAGAGDVALVAASDVTVPNSFGSPFGIQISKGTTLATANVSANGAINGASVRLFGARQDNVTDALLSVGSNAVLTATKIGGTVVLSAGVADGTMTLTGAAADTDGTASIAHAGTIAFAASDAASATIRSNAVISGGGSIGTLAREATAVTIAGASDVTLGNIAARDDFTLAAAGNLTLGDVASRTGHVDLSTTPATAFIRAGALAAATFVKAAAAGDATVAGAVTAGTDYTVSGANVTLGATGTTPTQKAVGLVDINAVSQLRGLGGVILQSNSGGAADPTDTRAVHLRAGRTIIFDEATQVLAGTSRQSVLGVNAGGALTLGTARARQLGEYSTAAEPVFSEGLTVGGDFTAKLLEITGKIDITASASMFLGSATSLTGDILLTATTGGIGGFASGTAADLTADNIAAPAAVAADRKIQATAATSVALGTLSAGRGAGGLNAYQIDVKAGTTAAVASATTADGALRIRALGGTATLGSAALKGDLLVAASDEVAAFFDASVTGKVTTGGDYTVRGASVTLGGDACGVGGCSQSAAGSFVATANGGSLIGKSGYTFQSNSGGLADPVGGVERRQIDLTAKGGAISFASDSVLLAGTDLQSLLVLNGEATVPADALTALTLGVVKARGITGADLGPTYFTNVDFTAADILTANTLDLRATAGSLHIGAAESRGGNINLVATAGDITGAALVPAPASAADYGGAALTARTVGATITAQGIATTSTVKLAAVTAGQGTATSAADQIAVSGGTIVVPAALVANNGALRLVSSAGEVTVGAGTSARRDAVVDAFTNARVGALTSLAGNVTVTARGGDITGLALVPSPATPADYGRAGLTASGTDATILARALAATSTVKLGAISAGNGTTTSAVAGDQVSVTGGTIDVASAVAKNGALGLTSATGGVLLGAGSSARLDAVVDAFTSARIGDLTSLAGNVSVTARGGDITGLATVAAPASLADYGRAALSATGIDKTVTATALTTTSSVKLGALNAGAGTTPRVAAGDQIAVSGGALDIASAVASNGSLKLTATTGDVVLGAGSSARLAVVVDAAVNARLGGLASLADALSVTARGGDISGLALTAGDPDETLFARFGRADLGAATGMTLTAAGGVQLGNLTTTAGTLTVDAGSDATPSDGAIDLTSVAATAGSFALTAISANVAAPVYNGGVTLGSGAAGLDGAITARGAIALGTATTTTTTGRDLTLSAGRFNVPLVTNSTAAKATVRGIVTVGNAGTGNYAVTATSVDLGAGTEQATGTVGITAYGVAPSDGLTGATGLTLVSNSGNAAAANAMTLRADGGAGIRFVAGSTVLGGTDGVSADIGIHDPLATLTLGTVRARSLQGLDVAHPTFGTLAAPNLVDVTGNVLLAGAVTTLGVLDLRSRTGDITALQAITIGAVGDSDRGLRLTATDATTGGATTGRITVFAPVQTRGDVTLDGYGTIRLASITASPAAGGAVGAIKIASTAGDVTGLADVLVPLAGFHVGAVDAGSGGVAMGVALAPLPDNAVIDSINSVGDVKVTASNLRLGSATSQAGSIGITTSGALTGLVATGGGSAVNVGNVSADLLAGTLAGTVTVSAGGAVGGAHAVNLRTVQAGSDITITADRIAIEQAKSGGTLRLAAGSVLAVAEAQGRAVVIGGGGAAFSPPIVSDFDADLLDTNYGSTALTAVANGKTITIAAGTIAQLGAVTAGTSATLGTTDQIHIDAGALAAQSLKAQNGNIFASATRAVAAIGSPLYVGTITAANAVTLNKTLGVVATTTDELRVRTIDSGLAGAGAIGDVTITSATHARLGTITALGGSVTAKAVAGDLTGLIGASNTGAPPQPAYDLLVIDAAKAITLGAGRDLQARTLTAGTDIDATAGSVAWIGGDATARTGHYRVTGGTVTLGSPGGATQQAARDVAIRSTTGAITGGAALTLLSDSLGSGADTNYLVLDSAGAITFADGLGSAAISALRGGVSGTTADIGIRLGAGSTLQLGSVFARTLGTAVPAGAVYSVNPILTTAGAIALRDVQVVRDLAIDNFGAGGAFGLTLDSAVSSAGGIALATAGDLHGAAAPGGFVRTDLTAARGIDTQSGGFTLIATADAGTGARLVTGGDLDLRTLTTHAGDAVLRAGGDLRADTVTASGDGASATLAAMLADAAVVPLRHLAAPAPGSAGDILAEAGGNITDVARHAAFDSIAAFTSTSSGVTLRSLATAAGQGLVAFDTAQANGIASGHRDVSIEGRRIVTKLAEATGGGASLSATESGAAQNDVSISAITVRALGDATLSAGYGTGDASGADNGSIRVGTVTTGTGAVTLTALDGDVTGLAGSATGLDAGHDRALVHAGGAVGVTTGGLFQASDVTGSAITAAVGDVTQVGVVANTGAIDVGSFTASGPLSLTAKAATATGGYNGDIRIGALTDGTRDPAAAATTVDGTTTLTTSGARGDIILATGLTGTGAVAATSVGNIRLSMLAGAGDTTLTALDGDVTGLVGTSTGLDAAHDRAIVRAGGAVGVTTGGLFQAADVTGTAIVIAAGDVTSAGVAANDGAVDVSSFTVSGPLAVTTHAAGLSAGYNGDIRIGALADGTLDPAAALTTVGGATTLTTSGVRGDIVIAGGLAGTGAVTAASIGNIRLSAVTGGADVTLSALDGDVTGLVGTSTGLDVAHDRAIVHAGGGVGVTVGGLLQAADVTGAAIAVEAGDLSQPGVAANNGAIDVSSFTAGGPLRLTARVTGSGGGYDGDIRIGALASGARDPAASATTVGGTTTLTTSGIRGDIIVASGLTSTGDVTATSLGNIRLSNLTGTSAVTLTALDGDVTGLVGTSTGLDAAHDRAIVRAGGAVGVITGGLLQAAAVTGTAITVAAGDVSQAGVVANNGAIDVGSFTASGSLSLTAKAATLTGGYDGDIRIGALASGALDPAALATTAGGITTLTTSGARGDIVIAGALTGAGAVTGVSIGNIRARMITTDTGSALSLSALDGDVTGLVGASTGLDAAHGRAVIIGGGSVNVVAGGLFQAAGVGGSAITVEAGDVSQAGRIANTGAIDVSSFTASGPLKLTAKAASATGGYGGDIRIGALAGGQFDPAAVTTTIGGITTLTTSGVRGDILVAGRLSGAGDVTVASVKNIRLADAAGRLIQSSGGKIAVTASDGAITGLLKAGASGAQLADYGSAVLKTTGAGGIALAADRGAVKLGAVGTNNGDIAIVASDADLSGAISVGHSGAAAGTLSTISIVRGALATGTDLGTVAAGTGTRLALGEAELALLAADKVTIDALNTDVRIGTLAINAATGGTALEFLGSGTFTLSGAIKDAGAASSRTLQIGGADGTLGTAPLTTEPLAAAINATIAVGGTGVVITLPQTTLDLRAKRIAVGDATLLKDVATATAGLNDADAAQKVQDLYVGQPSSRLYTGYGSNSDVFLTAKVLTVSYSGYALFQNTGSTALGAGVVLGDTGAPKSVASLALLLRSVGETPTNAFGLFGTINGFVGRTAGLLPAAVIDFAVSTAGNRVTRITQSNSRVNGCVIGSPDRGCLVTDVPPPNLNLFDERQLQLFGVADDLTIPFEPPIGTSNEALIGDFTTTGGVVDPDCTVPGDARCPAQGTRP